MSGVLTTPARTAGTVKWFDEPHGFGFIGRDDGRPNCFVHRFDFRGGSLTTLAAGDRVEFAVVEREKGPWADDVTRGPPRPAITARRARRGVSAGDTLAGAVRGEATMRTARQQGAAARRLGAASAAIPPRTAGSPGPSLRRLSHGECEAVLARNVVGRIAVANRGHVDIAPTSYVYADGWLYARADRALRSAIRHNRWVAVEVAEIQGVSDWRSVVARGACYGTSPNGCAGGEAATAAGVALLRDRVPEMSREGQTMPIAVAIFRVHVDELTGCRATSPAALRKPVASVRSSEPRGAPPAPPRRTR